MTEPHILTADSAVVIVGAGQAGVQAAISLRSKGFLGGITLVGDEPHEPYQRPPLSKTFISGNGGHETVALRPKTFYADQQIHLCLNERAATVDRDLQQATLASGTTLGYDHLIIATGVRARTLPVPGGDLRGVMTIRGLDDAGAIRAVISAETGPARPAHVVVVGGGFIGMEFAAMAAGFGHQVTIVEAMPRTLARATSPEVSAHLEAVHLDNGNRILVGQGVRQLTGDEHGHVTHVELTNGNGIPADLVLVGIGVAVNSEFLDGIGLDTEHGIAVDEHLQTADTRISAVGDCALYPSVHGRRRMRVESVQNAVDQGRYVAEHLLALEREPYKSVPWFWTHQFKEKVQMAGIAGPNDIRVVVGDQASGRFSVLHFAGDELTCVESVNAQGDHMAARKALQRKLAISEADARRSGFGLAQHVKSQSATALMVK